PVNMYQKNQGSRPAAAVSAANGPTSRARASSAPSRRGGGGPPTSAGTAARPASPPSSAMIAVSVPSPTAITSHTAPGRSSTAPRYGGSDPAASRTGSSSA